MGWDGKVTENFTDRLQRAARNGTGYLEVHDTARERRGWVFFEHRDVVAVLVDGYQPRLARRLIASEFVSIADMAEVLTVTKDEYDPRIADECVARGLVDAVTMKVLNREFMLSAASCVDEWRLGECHWVPDVPPWEGRSTAVPVPLLVSAMVRRKAHWGRLWTELSTMTIPDRVPVRTGPADYRAGTPDEAAVISAVDGKRTVDQVAGECGFTRFQTGHLISALMTQKVLDLFPAKPQSISNFIRVQAGYYAASEPVPDVAVPAADVYTGGRQPGEVAPTRPWVVPMTLNVPLTPQAHPDSMHERTQNAVTGPVNTDDPEGNVVTQHVEVEDAGGVLGSGPAPVEVGPVAAERSGSDADEPQPVAPVGEESLATDESLPEMDQDPDLGQGAQDWAEATEASQLVTNLGEFFVSNALPPAAPARAPATAVVGQHALPPLPAITGGPSDFYAVLPSALPSRPAGFLRRTLPGLPVGAPPAQPAARQATEGESASPDPMTPGQPARAEKEPELDPAGEAVADGDVKEDVKGHVDGDLEVATLRDELLRLAAVRRAAVDHFAVLDEEVLLHSTNADAAAMLVEEADLSIARLTRVTGEALAIADGQLEGLECARQEDARVARLRAQVDEDAEKARKAVVLGQHKFDESSAVHANLERDLQVEMAGRETVLEAWTAATEAAMRSAAEARRAKEAAAECDQLIEDARERLIEMANADR